MEKLYTVSKTKQNKTKQNKPPGADCGSDHELLIAKFRLKLKKVGKTTRPFRYDLNQIPYYYTVEVTNRPSPRKRNAKRQNGCLKRLTSS